MPSKQDNDKPAGSNTVPIDIEAIWHTLTRHSPNLILLVNANGEILYTNRAFAGHDIDDLTGSELYRYFSTEVTDTLKKSIRQVITSKKPARINTCPTRRKNNHEVYDVSVYPIVDKNADTAVLIEAHNVTPQQSKLQRLEQHHLLLNTVIAQTPIIIWALDTEGRFTLSEGKGLEALDLVAGEVVGKSIYNLYKSNKNIIESCEAALQGREITNITRTAGRTYHSSYSPVRDRTGQVTGIVGVANDITDLEHFESQLQILSRTLEQTTDLVLITDADGKIEYVNPAFEKTTGYHRDEVIGNKPRILRSGKHDNQFYQMLWDTILRGEVFTNVFVNVRKDGSIYYEEKTITPIRDNQNTISHFVSTGKDISERMRVQERLQYMAHHDALTKLPNRTLFMDRLRQAMARAQWHKRQIAVMFLDLDRFKNINDSLGHLVGDQLLIQLTQRLQSGVRTGDTIARFGGDEFAILLDDIATEKDIAQLAKKILDTMIAPFNISNREFFMTASIGVSIFPNDGEDPDTLLRTADIAMYRAKDLGRNNYQFYSNEMSARAFERLTLENSLRHALKRREFSLYYQPQVEIRSRNIIGVEALLRWNHPELGLIMPGDFIPLLEETGLIVEVGDWVLQTALEQTARWHSNGFDFLKVSINLSSRQFNNPEFIPLLESSVRNSGLTTSLIELELTESMLMRNASKTINALNTLHRLGINIAVDDFGTGYSSLNYLRRFPISTLKIDRSFIRDVTTDQDDRAITTAIIVMAQSLNLIVVAEGVETEEQVIFLESLDCDQMQGNICSSPVPASTLTRMLSAQKKNQPPA